MSHYIKNCFSSFRVSSAPANAKHFDEVSIVLAALALFCLIIEANCTIWVNMLGIDYWYDRDWLFTNFSVVSGKSFEDPKDVQGLGGQTTIRLVMYNFVHVNSFHFLTNMAVLALSRTLICNELTIIECIVVIASSSVGGALMFTSTSPENATMVGFSSILVGLVVTSLVLEIIADRPESGIVFSAAVTLVGVAVVIFLPDMLGIPTAWQAHVGGATFPSVIILLLKFGGIGRLFR